VTGDSRKRQSNISEDSSRRGSRHPALVKILKRISLGLGALLFFAIWAVQWERPDAKEAIQYQTAEVRKGDLVEEILATGTLEPEDVIDVGAQVAGRIVSFGTDINGDPIDYGSRVEKGSLLVRLDAASYKARRDRAQADVDSAAAEISKAVADRDSAKILLLKEKRDLHRMQGLRETQTASQEQLEDAETAFEHAAITLRIREASVLAANAAKKGALAELHRAQRDLDYCTIVAPVNGVVIDRRVNIGQTVVANLDAPSLFLLAKDTKRMQIGVAVNETDICRIAPGQPVRFRVDALPGRTFTGEVRRVRLNAAMTQNVVTYTVEVTAMNDSSELLPYLTAEVDFEVMRLRDALLVPRSALNGPENNRSILVLENGSTRRIPVEVIARNDTTAALRAPELKVGMPAIIGISTSATRDKENRGSQTMEQDSGVTSPFLPKPPSGSGPGGGPGTPRAPQ
jgi:HlyD family secretion protein